jgi:hypothetical protein
MLRRIVFLFFCNLAVLAALYVTSPLMRTIAVRPDLWGDTVDVALSAAADRLAEEPHFAEVRGTTKMPICENVNKDHAESLAFAFNLMRQTTEGERLFQQLVDEAICVRVGEIDYNSGYAYVVQSITGSWSRSYIQIATRHVTDDERDVLAALLVHEATHVDRYIHGTACTYSESCTVLPNGVELEEEVEAHRAEAEWWIAAYGENGKRLAIGYDFGMNELVDAYLDGEDAFVEYIAKVRGDDREGGDAEPGG